MAVKVTIKDTRVILKMPLLVVIAILLTFTACHRASTPPPSSPLPQRAYVWQREWMPSVASAVRQATPKLHGFVIFGAEIYWQNGQPKALLTSIDWQTLRALRQPVSIAMRIASYPGPFAEDDAITQKLAATAAALLERMRQERVECAEFQLDFDCAQKKLAGYMRWLAAIRAATKPTRLVITTLPAWLDEPAFPALLDHTDGYILQVHSIAPTKTSAHALVCDPVLARTWVAKASALRHPFEVALSTYSAVAGYDAQGKFLGLALDGVQPAWPSGTKLMNFESDAAQIATLVHEWQTVRRPLGLQGLLWYRLPVSSDVRNWRWPTFSAVIEGRAPASHLTVQTQGENPADLTLVNDGEADENLDRLQAIAAWPEASAPPSAVEALPGWTAMVAPETRQIRFIFSGSQTQRLSPGARRGIGWVRFNQRVSLHVEIIR